MNSRVSIIENEHACLWYYPDTGIVHHKFIQPAADKYLRSVLLTGLDLLKRHGAQKWLSDDRNNTILSAEDSAWTQDYWLPRALKAGWRYWAVLPPAKTRGQINMQRLMEFVGERSRVNIKICSDPDEALQWLEEQGASE